MTAAEWLAGRQRRIAAFWRRERGNPLFWQMVVNAALAVVVVTVSVLY